MLSKIAPLTGCSTLDKPCMIKMFSKGLHNRLEIGIPNCDDGVLFVLSVEDREMYVSVEQAAKKYFTENNIKKLREKL